MSKKPVAVKKGSRRGMTVAERLDKLDGRLGTVQSDVAGMKGQLGEMQGWMKKWLDEDRKRIEGVEACQTEQGKSISRMQGWLAVVGAIAMVALGAWLSSVFGG